MWRDEQPNRLQTLQLPLRPAMPHSLISTTFILDEPHES